MRRKITVIASLSILLLAITVSILYFKRDYFAYRIEQKIVSVIENKIGRRIKFTDSRINIRPFYWVLNNASLHDFETDETLLTTMGVSIHLELNASDIKTILIRDIEFKEPVLTVTRYPDGKTNLEGIFPKRTPTGWKVIIDRIDINNGNVLYDDQYSGRRINLKALHSRIIPDLKEKEIKGTFSAEGAYKDSRISRDGLDINGEAAINIEERKIKTASFKNLDITSTAGSKLQVTTGVIEGDGSIDISGSMVLSLVDAAEYVPDKKGLEGRVIFTGGVKGSFAAPVVAGSIDVDGFSYDSIRYGDLKGDLSYEENLLSLSDIRSEIMNGRIEGGIKIDLKEDIPSYNVSLKGTGLHPYEPMASYLPRFGQHMKKDGVISGEIEAQGISFDKNSMEGKGWISYKDSDQKLALSGRIKKGLEASLGFTGELADIASYLHIPRFPLHGLATLNGEVSGLISMPVINGVVMMRTGRVKDIAFDSITADLKLSEGRLYLQPVTFRKGSASYSISGNIHFRSPGFKDPYFDLEGDINQGAPEDLVGIFYRRPPMSMKADGHLKFSGDVHDFVGAAELNASGVSIYGERFDRAQVAINLTKDRVIFNRVKVERGEEAVAGTGWIGFRGDVHGDFFADINSEQFSIENIGILKKRLPYLRGTGVFKMTGSGKIADPVMEASIQVPSLFIRDVDAGPARLLASKKGTDAINVRGEVLYMRYNGNVIWDREAPFILTFHMDDSSIQPLLSLLRPSISNEISLNAAGKVLMEGKLARRETLKARVILTSITGFYGDYRVENDGEVRLSFEENRLTFDSVRFRGEGTSLGVIGSFVPYGDINVFINGEADLRLLTLMTPEIKYSKGNAFVAFLLSGEMGNPSIQGGLVVKDGTIRSSTLKQTLEGASISVFFNGREIVLESMNGILGGGTVNASGKVEIEEFDIQQFAFALEIADSLFRYPEGLASRIDGTLLFHGTPKSKSLKGEVRIKKASYEKNINIRSLILELQRKRVRIEQPVPFFGDTDLNIHIAGKKNIWINNNLAKLPVNVDLLLKGTIDHPLLFGMIEAEDGTFVFSRNPFKVISATADFISPDTIRPVIDVHATTTVREYNIDLRLSGTMERFVLSLNSDPPLSETDILALLTVGQTAAEAAETMSEVGAVEATAFLAAPIQEKIEDTMQDIIKIDRFQVEPYYSSSTASEGARLTVGKRLLDDKLYVTYTTGITTIEELIKLEYFLGRNVYIVGERDELGRLSGDIKFRFEFR